MTGGRLSGYDCEDVAAAHLRLNEDYHVLQAHARQTSRMKGGRFDLLAFSDQHCLRVQVFRGDQLSEKLVQASGPTPHYCVDEVWQWAEDNSGFARWWQTEEGWRERDAVRITAPRKLVARADESLDDEVET